MIFFNLNFCKICIFFLLTLQKTRYNAIVINEIFRVKFVQSDENVIKEKKENVQKRENVSILYEYT